MTHKLIDIARTLPGWPADIKAIARLLEAADRALPGGRNYNGPITDEQLSAMGYCLTIGS